jgi:hypothetical protein
MLDPFSRDILNRRPNIQYISPPSEDVIPEPQPDAEPSKPERVQRLVNSFRAIEQAALAVEDAIAKRAKDVTMELNLSNPEDFVAAQAAGRLFPDAAEEVTDGVKVVKTLTYDMYHQCIKAMKEHGKERGKNNQIPAVAPSMTKTDFGGLGMDRRPELNNMSIPFAPIDLLSYITATIPLLFGMLFPLIQIYVKTSIVGHTHIATAPGAPTLVGVPVVP